MRPSSQDKIAHDGERRESTRRRRDVGDEAADDRDRRDSRWDEHRRDRAREQLVEATLAAVGKHGAGVGMDEIAAEAGTSKTVVYRHFADRAELYVAVCNRVAVAAAAEAAGRDREQPASPAQMVAAAIDTYLAFLEADPELYRFVVHQQALDRPTSDPIEQPVRPRRRAGGGRDRGRPAAGRPRPGGRRARGATASSGWSARPPTGGFAPSAPCSARELAAHLTDLAWAGLSGVVTPAPPTSKEEQ